MLGETSKFREKFHFDCFYGKDINLPSFEFILLFIILLFRIVLLACFANRFFNDLKIPDKSTDILQDITEIKLMINICFN